MGNSRLRILVFAPRSRYINPTEEELFQELPHHCDVVFHGPGFTPMDQLATDARDAYDRYGPFDAAILHQYFLFDSLPAAVGSCYFPFDVKRFHRSRPGFPRNFSRLPCIRIAQLLRMDYYAVSKEMVAEMDAFAGYFITWSAQFVPSLKDLEDVAREGWETRPTDTYRDFALGNNGRILPYMHTVSERLFCRRNVVGRKWPVYVPGQLYALRHDAVAALRAEGYRIANRSRLTGALSRLTAAVSGRPLFSLPVAIRCLQKSFRNRIKNSLVCFTDGSRLRWPLRKYFEIPAFGSLLACEPFLQSESLGFLAGQHFVAAAPRDLPDVVRQATREPGWAAGLIDTSQAMVRRLHSPAARVGQLLRALRAVLFDEYRGACWENGQLALYRDAAAPNRDDRGPDRSESASPPPSPSGMR
jgi:hypothetical protein